MQYLFHCGVRQRTNVATDVKEILAIYSLDIR
jgi:hypothetical protein